MQTEDLLQMLVHYDRFTDIAVHLQWAETAVTHIEECDAPEKWHRVFITEIRFPSGFVAANLPEAFVQAMLTHLGCTEEWRADFFAKLEPEERASHLETFASELHYTEKEIGRSFGEFAEKDYAELLRSHCGASDFTKCFFSMFAKKNETFEIGSHSCTPCWEYMTISGDSILMTSLSVVC